MISASDITVMAEDLGVAPDDLCTTCGRLSFGVAHFGHTVTRVGNARPAPALREQTVPAPRAKIDVLTVQQIAADLDVSKMTVYRLVHSGELRSLRVGRSIRVREADYLAWLKGTETVVIPEGVIL